MDAWVWWLIIAGLLGIAEVTTTTLFFAMLAGGAVAGAGVAAVGAPVALQVTGFALVSLLLVVGARPVARRHIRMPIESRSGVAALVGNDAVVLESVTARDGRIKLGGEVWSARAYDGSSTFAPHADVFVVAIEGATALVAER